MAWRVQLRYGAEELLAHSSDVSASGMFLETRSPLPIGALLHLSFAVGGGSRREVVEAEAVVVRRVSPEEARQRGLLSGVGVAFSRILWGAEELDQAVRALARSNADQARRATPPLAVGIPVHWGQDPRVRRHAGFLSNLSSGGAFFVEAEELLTRGSRLFLWFEVPVEGEPRIVRAAARVVRVAGEKASAPAQPRGMGITLEDSPVDQRALSSFLDGRLSTVARQEAAERTHPTRIEELFLAAMAECETEASGAVGVEQRETARSGGDRRAASIAVDWARVGSTAFALTAFMTVALLCLFVGLLLQLV